MLDEKTSETQASQSPVAALLPVTCAAGAPAGTETSPAKKPPPGPRAWTLDPQAVRRKREAVLSDPAEARIDLRPLTLAMDPQTRRVRHDGWTLAAQRRFIETLAASGVVAQACDAACMSRQSAYMFRYHHNGRAFAALWEEACQIAGRGVVDDMISAAADGQTREVCEDGFVVAATRRKNPLKLVSMIEHIRSETLLGKGRTMAAARNFHACIDMLADGQVYADGQHPPIAIPAMPPPQELDLDNPKPAIYHRRWTPDRQRLFCEVVAQGGNVDQACRRAGRQRSGAYNLRNRAEGQAFALAWDAALLVHSNSLIDTAMAMARNGMVEEIARKGKPTRWRTTISPDVAMQVVTRLGALKAREDELYGDGYKRIGCARDFGAALDLLESGEALRMINAAEAALPPAG